MNNQIGQKKETPKPETPSTETETTPTEKVPEKTENQLKKLMGNIMLEPTISDESCPEEFWNPKDSKS